VGAYGGNNTAGAIDVATSCLAHPSPHCDFKTETFIVSDDPAKPISHNEQRTYTNEGKVFALRNVVGHPVGFTFSGYSNKPAWITGDRTDCLPSSGHSDGSHQGIGVMSSMAVRRLTPRECERLQGFPDNYTAILFRNKPAADGPRYKALGNSMAVPVMRWIGERIAMVERVCPE
jgi:DNA (cytosine-5)-methyltransferase 1